MALCPFATQKPVTSHGGPIGKILGVVIHVTAGEGDPYNEFANPNNQVSSHFGILNGQGGTVDGVIEQYVDTSLESWAQMAGNMTYLSVETEGEPTDPLTPAQLASFARLYAWMHSEHGIPFVITDTPGTPGFITHGDGGVPWGDHIDCPGPQRKAQRQAILNAAQPSPPSPTTQEATMNCLDPTSGGTWIVDPSDGHVETLYGAPYCGGLNNPPDSDNWQQVGQITGITPWKDPTGAWGYSIIVRHNAPIPATGAWYSGYTFPRKP